MEILLATDGSPQAKKAERAAIGIAKSYNIRIAALFVVNIMSAHSASERARSVKQGEKILDEVAAEGRKLGIEVQKVLEIGRIGNTILKVAKDLRVHTIILGCEGRNGLRFLVGSVTDRVVRNAECTVLVAR
ncbi:MAG: universal stress protein [Candidatus Methanoperedens sp.]|nr:universal stress protein [Candidatus Methanoperedens sp.]